MEDFAGTVGWSNKQLRIISQQRQRIRQIQERDICERIIHKEANNLDFYKITPKEELPKFLQKMKFQTLHIKEKEVANNIRIYKRENRRPEEKQLRKQLRAEGHIMLLSQIYQKLGQNGENQKRTTDYVRPYAPDLVPDLEEWEKLRKEQKLELTTTLLPRAKKAGEQRLAQISELHEKEVLVKQFREGFDYKGEIERSLGIIEVTHASEYNLMNRYLLVENSSKLLKRELDEKKAQVEESIKNKMRQLFEARTEYHNYFQERNRLKLEDQLLKEDLPKEDTLRISHKSLTSIRNDKASQLRLQKKEVTDTKIQKKKQNIGTLEEAIAQEEEELRKMMMAERLYFKASLKNGNDVRQSGLAWIIKKLEIREENMNQYEYPQFLDRKCRVFLVQKAASQEEEEQLLQEKRKFVNEIGRSNSEGKHKYKGVMGDRIIETDLASESVPKKYRRSLKKITLLNEEFIKNSSLLELRQRDRNRVFQISADLQGLTNKEIYCQIGERLKRIDLPKMKKEKIGSKKQKLIQYQSLLEKIKSIHIKLEEMDLQMENYLLSHYKDNRNLYFMQAAACFGYKRAHSMIIKHFSWKTYHEVN